MADGVEGTTIEDIAADAGVTVRTFYRHFASKHDLLFADYDAGLQWFRRAMAARPPDEPIIRSVQASILAFPYDVAPVTDLAALRVRELDSGQIASHLRRVEADLAAAIEAHLRRGPSPTDTVDSQLAVVVTARSIAAATFAAMELWITDTDRSMGELARLCQRATSQLASGFD